MCLCNVSLSEDQNTGQVRAVPRLTGSSGRQEGRVSRKLAAAAAAAAAKNTGG